MRESVLALAWLLCTTRRGLESYLAAAGLLPLSATETASVERLRERLGRPRKPTPMLLPPRPLRLLGRAPVLDDLVRRLRSGPPGLYAITGMVGVGKSALVAEALHVIAAESGQRSAPFRDGIVAVTTTGWQGNRGLISLLHILSHRFPAPDTSESECNGAPAERRADDGEVTRAANQVRAGMADREVLLLLDDLDPRFPLRRALDVLLVSGRPCVVGDVRDPSVSPRRIVLVTSRSVPPPALVVSTTSTWSRWTTKTRSPCYRRCWGIPWQE